MKPAWQAHVSQHPCSTFQAIREQGIAPVPFAASGPFVLQQCVRKIGLKITLKFTLHCSARRRRFDSDLQ
jgi:hypothetical protein